MSDPGELRRQVVHVFCHDLVGILDSFQLAVLAVGILDCPAQPVGDGGQAVVLVVGVCDGLVAGVGQRL